MVYLLPERNDKTKSVRGCILFLQTVTLKSLQCKKFFCNPSLKGSVNKLNNKFTLFQKSCTFFTEHNIFLGYEKLFKKVVNSMVNFYCSWFIVLFELVNKRRLTFARLFIYFLFLVLLRMLLKTLRNE